MAKKFNPLRNGNANGNVTLHVLEGIRSAHYAPKRLEHEKFANWWLQFRDTDSHHRNERQQGLYFVTFNKICAFVM
jgi:hypothetical protein